MAKRIFAAMAQTFTATAVTTTLTNATYMSIKGGTATQLIDVLEIKVAGLDTSSIAAGLAFSRSGTIATTPSALTSPNSDGPANPATALLANVPVTFVAATAGTIPSNSTADAKLDFSMNSFGGIIRWSAAPTQQWTILGNTIAFGENVLWNCSAYGGSSAKVNAHIIYEPY